MLTNIKPNYVRPLDIRNGVVDMNFGAGGKIGHQLINELFAKAFANEYLAQGNDGAVLPPVLANQKLVLSTDAHVISPLIFPGGDIGMLAVNGTINDVAMMGATPLYLSASFILEEGLPLSTLKIIVESMAKASLEARVPIVTGDTKVVEKGHGDGVYISTSGVGVVDIKRQIGGERAKIGDAILVSGSIGTHGIAILAKRENLSFTQPIYSDCAALHTIIAKLLDDLPDGVVHVLRDPTRGGLATTLNEIAHQSCLGMLLDEKDIPVLPEVSAVCELLGLDPLYIANEGKFIAIVEQDYAQTALEILRAHPLGENAAIIGSVHRDSNHFVQMQTQLGGRRVVDWLSGEPLPRIC